LPDKSGGNTGGSTEEILLKKKEHLCRVDRLFLKRTETPFQEGKKVLRKPEKREKNNPKSGGKEEKFP